MNVASELRIYGTGCNACCMSNTQASPSVLEWTLGDRLGKALRIANVSHQEMAEVLGVKRNTVGNYIADRTPVKDGVIRVWAMRTGVSYEELKTGRPSNGTSPDGTPEKITVCVLPNEAVVTQIRPALTSVAA